MWNPTVSTTFPQFRSEELDDMIHIEEVRKAVEQMKCNKASGGDGIPAEVYKHGGTALVGHLHRLLLKIWKNEEVPQELKYASIVTIFKKGSRTECGKVGTTVGSPCWVIPRQMG